MQKFVQFLVEKASKPAVFHDLEHGETNRHWNKYVESKRKNKIETNFVMDKPVKDIPAGSTVKVTSKTPIWKNLKVAGKERPVAHAKVQHLESGKSALVRLSHIQKDQSEKRGRYNDEHAFVGMANYALQNHITKAEQLQSAVHQAKSDPTHPLHFSKVPAEQFHGKIKNEKSEKSYYNELHDVTNTVQAMASHPKFAPHWNNTSKLHQQGETSYVVHDYHDSQDRRVRSKADVAHFVNNNKVIGTISLKHGPAQAMSGGRVDTARVYHHAISSLGLSPNHPVHKQYKQLNKLMDRKNEAGQHFSEIRQHLEKMHKSTPGLTAAVYATSLKGPYLPKEGRAEYIASTPMHTEAARRLNKPLKPAFFGTVEKYVEHIGSKGKLKLPNVDKGKDKGARMRGEPTVRLITP